jgi:hypothetical protein
VLLSVMRAVSRAAVSSFRAILGGPDFPVGTRGVLLKDLLVSTQRSATASRKFI